MYKRQQDGRADKTTVVIAFAETATAIGAVVSGFFHDCFFAVSYTHLDVYKRQEFKYLAYRGRL